MLACTRVGAHVLVIVHERERKREEERGGESESEEGGRGNSPALPSDCVQCCKEVQPSPVGVHTHSKGPGEGNHPASVTHPHLYHFFPFSLPPMLHSIPQTQSQIATSVPHSSSSPHFDQLPFLLYLSFA